MRFEMNSIIRTILLLIVTVAFFRQPALNAADRSKIKEGVEAFKGEQWDEALNQFQDALVDDPTNPLLHYNVGDALYKKKNYEEAVNSYEKALNTNDIQLQGKSYYNIGNSYYRLNKYQEAIDYYKKALELNPDDVDAKYNLELVRAKIKEMADKQQMNNQQQQSQEKQQGEQQQQQQQEGGEKENQQQQAEQQQDEQEQKQQDQQQQEKQQAMEDQQKQEQQQAAQAEEKKELTKEEAERILRALRSKEDENKKLRPMPKRGGKAQVEKDW